MRIIKGKVKEISDGFAVARLLPHIDARSVGPFVFFDAFGPVDLPPGKGLDVRPHPHIGLATVTYLFEGGQVHRDSLGTVQEIRPGDVNWMTAGRGIVHSERTSAAMRAAGHRMHGIQCWVGLPKADEEAAPAFQHVPGTELPAREDGGVHLRLVVGTGFGLVSPVRVFSPIFYADITLRPGARMAVPQDHPERGLYVVDGSLTIAGQRFDTGDMVVFEPRENIELAAASPSRAMLFGGAPLDGPRHLWWNFVSSSQDRIAQAKRDWAQQNMGHIDGDDEFIPLPE